MWCSPEGTARASWGARSAATGSAGSASWTQALGSIEDTAFTANRVGVSVADTASPVLVGGTITGGDVGLQVSDDAAPLVSEVTIRGAQRAAVIYSGTASGALTGVTCRDVPFGIVVGPSVAPTLKDNSCDLAASKE